MGYSGDGGPATQAQFGSVSGIAFGPDGALFIVDGGNSRVRRVGTDGIITTVVGDGNVFNIDDGGPAVKGGLYYPGGLSVGPDGSIYITDYQHFRIRRVDPTGIITTVAGNGSGTFPHGIPATSAGIGYVGGVTLAPEGTIYMNAFNRVLRVDQDGIITVFAGTGSSTFNGTQGPATQIALNNSNAAGIAVGPSRQIVVRTAFQEMFDAGSPAAPVALVWISSEAHSP